MAAKVHGIDTFMQTMNIDFQELASFDKVENCAKQQKKNAWWWGG